MKSLPTLSSSLLCPALLTVALFTARALAASYDVAADFSTNSNPNGVWSYGYSDTLTSELELYPDCWSDNGLHDWFDRRHSSATAPSVAHNGTVKVVTSVMSPVFSPGEFSLHPGPNGEYSHARWVAPVGGRFTVKAVFDAREGATTDVHVLRGGISIFDGAVNGKGSSASFTTNMSVCAGEWIDFAVGYGRNHTFYGDTTGLSAQIFPFGDEPAQQRPESDASDAAPAGGASKPGNLNR